MRFSADGSKSDGYIWRCPTCRAKKSIRDGSFFSKSKLDLCTLVEMIYYWAIRLSQGNVMEQLRIVSKSTLVDWFNFIRDICIEWHRNHPMLGGPGMEVEIDESLFMKAKNHRGRNLNNDDWILGGVERGTGRCFLEALPRGLGQRSAQTMLPYIQRWVAPGTRIITDSWAAYQAMQLKQQGYQHDQVTDENGYQKWNFWPRKPPSSNFLGPKMQNFGLF